jgi:tetratricopeptide (TPR) repeat protein
MATAHNDDLAVGEALIRDFSDLMDPVEQHEALDGVWECHERLVERDRRHDALRLLDQLLAAQLDRESEEGSDEAAREIAQTMLKRAWGQWNLDRFVEAAAQCADLLDRFDQVGAGAPDWVQECVASALFYRGDSFLQLKRWLESLAVFDELIAREPEIPTESRRWVANARTSRGEALEGLGDKAAALDAYSEVAELADDDDPSVACWAERGMRKRATLLMELGQVEEAIAAYDVLFAVPDPFDLREVAIAYVQKTAMLMDRHDFDAAIAAADTIMQRFGSSNVALIRKWVAMCLDMKITCLRALGRKDAAAHAADQLVDAFGADLDPRIETIVAPHAHRVGRSRSRIRFRGIG